MGTVYPTGLDWHMPSSPIVYEAAHDAWRSACDLYEQIQSTRLRPEERALHESILASSASPGLYRHWKSTTHDARFYLVRGIDFVGDLRCPRVSYVSLYGDHAGEIEHRDLLAAEDGFLAPIYRPSGPPFSYEGQRFRQIATIPSERIDMLCERAVELARVHSEHDLMQWVQLL